MNRTGPRMGILVLGVGFLGAQRAAAARVARGARLVAVTDVRPGLAKRITAVAPSTSSLRRTSLPCRLMRPCRRLPPEELSFGVRPSHAAKCRPERKLLGSVCSTLKQGSNGMPRNDAQIESGCTRTVPVGSATR